MKSTYKLMSRLNGGKEAIKLCYMYHAETARNRKHYNFMFYVRGTSYF